MSLSKTLLRNVASNGVGYAVQVAVAFFLTPFILRSLGETRYGVWTVAVGLMGYYGLLDLGFSAGINQYLTRHLAIKDLDGVNRTASTGVVALGACGVLAFLVSAVIAFNATRLFTVPSNATHEVALVIFIMGASVALQFWFFTYSAVFTALQRFDLSNAIGIVTRVISALATVACLRAGYGLIGLSLVLAGMNLADYLVRFVVATRLLPELRLSLRAASLAVFKDIVKFGVGNIAVAGSVRLISYTDSLVIAAFLPISAVAPFAVAASLRSYFDDVFIRVGQVFFPAATQLDAQGDGEGLQRLYLVSSRIMAVGAVVTGALAIFWSRDFFRLWVGHQYAEPEGYPSMAAIGAVLFIASIVTAAQRIGYQVLLGTRQVGILARLFVAEGIANLVLSVALVHIYGVIGVALGTLIPAVVFQGVLHPVTLCRRLQVSAATYLAQVLLRPAVLAGVMLVLARACQQVFPPIGQWGQLIVWATVSGTVAAGVAVLVGLTVSDREFLIGRPYRALVLRYRARSEEVPAA